MNWVALFTLLIGGGNGVILGRIWAARRAWHRQRVQGRMMIGVTPSGRIALIFEKTGRVMEFSEQDAGSLGEGLSAAAQHVRARRAAQVDGSMN